MFKDKVAIVTGGASGIGFAIAEFLSNNGALVAVLDINKKNLEKLNNVFVKYQVDITNYQILEETIEDIISKYKKIDILINNAGVIYNKPLIDITNSNKVRHGYKEFCDNIQINLSSVFAVSSIVVEQMVRKRTKGIIINISSISANGNTGQTAYSAAKSGVNAMTKVWAKELGPFGIRTAAIAPGFIDISSTNNALSKEALLHVKSNTPLRKLGSVNNINQTVEYIIKNDFINGAVLDVDGGLTI